MRIKKFQEGGEAPMEPMPQEQQPSEEQVMQQIAQMAQEIIQQIGPEAAAMLAQAIMEMVQGGGAEGAPEEQQFMRKGGKLMKCGAKMKKKAKGGKC